MTGLELRKALHEMSWKRSTFARTLGVTPGTVSRWLSDDDVDVPGPVAAYVDLAIRVKQALQSVSLIG